MLNRTFRGRSHVLAAAITALALAATAGCAGGGGGWKPPAKGQAAVLVSWDDQAEQSRKDADNGSTAKLGFEEPGDLAFGSDGLLYGLDIDLVRIDGDRTAHVVLDEQVKGAQGLVPQPGGAFLSSDGAEVIRLQADGKVSVLAKAAGNDRAADAVVPASAAVGAVHFSSGGALPFGERPDGSVLLADGAVVWSLKDGHLTRLYQAPAAHDKHDPTSVMQGSTVNGSGTAWVAAGSLNHQATVGDLRTIAPDGTVATPSLPAKAAGVPGSLASLRLFWLADDGSDGVYAHASGPSGDYVLHLRPGSASLVARHQGDPKSAKEKTTCNLPHPVDAMKMPCWLPWALTYHAGRLTLAGFTRNVLTIAVS